MPVIKRLAVMQDATGLKMYFDKALYHCLLYDHEVEECEQVAAKCTFDVCRKCFSYLTPALSSFTELKAMHMWKYAFPVARPRTYGPKILCLHPYDSEGPCHRHAKFADSLSLACFSWRDKLSLAIYRFAQWIWKAPTDMVFHTTQVLADGIMPSQLFGGEHLLRLCAKLPYLVPISSATEEGYALLQAGLATFVDFLSKNKSAFFFPAHKFIPIKPKT